MVKNGSTHWLAAMLSLGLVVQLPSNPPSRSPAVSGVVLRASDREPLSRARVELVSSEVAGRHFPLLDLQNWNRGFSQNSQYSTWTDEFGRFEILGIEPGRYRIRSKRDGYMQQEWGALTDSASGSVVEVQPRQTVSGLTVSMQRAPSIFGRVFSPSGEPLAGVSVEALRRTFTHAGLRTLRSVRIAETDDLGSYRLFWLMSGEYIVKATYAEGAPRSELASTPGKVNIPPPEEGYGTIYAPGTTVAAEAQPIRLTAGAEFGPVNFHFSNVRQFSIRGTVFDISAGKPATLASVAIVPRVADIGTPITHQFPTGADGRFEIRGVSPGAYTLMATSGRIQGSYSEERQVIVANQDIENAALVLSPPITLSGSVRFESSTGPTPGYGGTVDPSSVVVEFVKRDGLAGRRLFSRPTKDGSLSVRDFAPGAYHIFVSGIPVGWYLKSVLLDKIDAIERGLQISFDRQRILEIILATGGGRLEGRVVDSGGHVASSVVVAILPETNLRHRDDRFRVTTTDPSGHFVFLDIASGKYTLAALESLGFDEKYDPQTIRRISSGGQIIEIAEGGQYRVELKVIGR